MKIWPSASEPVSGAARTLSAILASYAFLAALGSFIGWVADVRFLTDWDQDGISIQPNACLAALAAAAGLILLVAGRKRLGAAAGILAALIGGSALFESLFGVDLKIDTLFLFDRPWGQVATLTPGRMGPPGALSWTILGTGLLLAATTGRRARQTAALLGLISLYVAALSLIGYLFGVNMLYSLPKLTAIALQTSTMIFAVALGLILTLSDRQPVREMLAGSAAGMLARRSLPFVVLLPIVLGWLRLRGQEAGLFDTAMGTALLVLALILLLSVVMWWGVSTVAARERELAAVNEARLRAAQALREADKRKDEFLATLSHELRNPLAAMRNCMEIIKRSDATGSTLGNARATMERQMAQMVRLIDDLLDISRITRDKLELRKQHIALTPLIRQAVEACRPVADSAGIQLIESLPDVPLPLLADGARLIQVFSNLLDNACKYTPRGGSVRISAEPIGSEVIVSVRDTGAGIPPAMLGEVFTMFTQVHESLEQRHGGLGLGLTLVKRLVEMHGGTVAARSEGRGRGSEFVVRLPLAAEAQAGALPEPVAAASARAPQKILVVDDNRDAAASLGVLLQLSGNEIQLAHDGVEAVEKAGTYRPDVILLDIGMPKMNGYEACRAIRANSWGRDIAIVAMTGWGQEADRRKSQDAGFDRHLVKPVNHDVLMTVLSSFAGDSRQAPPARN
jgi:signal transduction histidine kinase/CheY-like chemotaxis protein